MKKHLEVTFIPTASTKTPVVGHVVQMIIKNRRRSFVVVEYRTHTGKTLRECFPVVNGRVQDVMSYRQKVN